MSQSERTLLPTAEESAAIEEFERSIRELGEFDARLSNTDMVFNEPRSVTRGNTQYLRERPAANSTNRRMKQVETTNGNGQTETVKVTPIGAAHQRFLANGAKKPSAKDVETAKKAIREAEKAFAEANALVEKARDMRHKAAIAAVELLGSKARLDLGGDLGVMVPAGQGERVFYRRAGEGQTY